MNNTYFKYAFVFLLFITTHYISAQIISTGHTGKGVTSYSDNDTIFFYSDIESASLTAMPPPGGTNVTYTWERYESGSWVNSIIGNDPTFIDIKDGGAYRVTVNNNGVVAGQFICWTLKPEILSLAIDTVYVNCRTQFETKITTKELGYVNLIDGSPLTVDYQLSYSWTSTLDLIDEEMSGAKPSITTPWEESTFTVSVSAFNGAHTMDDSYLFSEPLNGVKANFTYDVFDRENQNELSETSEYKDLTGAFVGSSEIVVNIKSLSKGLNKRYNIDFSNEDKSPELELLEITFDQLGSYEMRVTVKNSVSGCSDTQTLGPIEVQEIELEVPNVFTPDGDGTNDEFMVIYKSIKKFKMVVLNRWGRKVFQTTDPGKAWNGKIGGKNAAEGVYFYVVTAEGYNKGESRKMEGSVHLFRGN